MKTVREQLAEALERLFLYEADQYIFEAKYGAPKFPDSNISVEAWLEQKVRGPARAALDRHRAEPEGCICDTCPVCAVSVRDCQCYQEGTNEGHSMGCNDDSCACWAAGHEAGTEAQRERVGGGTA